MNPRLNHSSRAAAGVAVSIDTEDNPADVLTLRGEMKQQEEKKERAWHIREHRWGSFERSIALPTQVTADRANAEFEHGILTITLPKAEEVKPKSISVKAK